LSIPIFASQPEAALGAFDVRRVSADIGSRGPRSGVPPGPAEAGEAPRKPESEDLLAVDPEFVITHRHVMKSAATWLDSHRRRKDAPQLRREGGLPPTLEVWPRTVTRC
jgi:hypothetical protein